MSALHIDPALVDRMVENALTYCAARNFSGDKQQALVALRLGQCDACRILSDQLVRQVGEYLGQMDRTVKAVYEFQAEFSTLRPQTVNWSEPNRKAGRNLVAWVERKNPALSALGATLEGMLLESRKRIGCKNATPACYTLDVQMVDDRDVLERRGYGLLTSSQNLNCLPVWVRPGQGEQDAGLIEAGLQAQSLFASFDPEIIPEPILFDKARQIEEMTTLERSAVEHHLQEIKVVLIRRIISDQLAYINIAKDWFTLADLRNIYRRKIGNGKIGGKAAGMLLAERILNELADESVKSSLRVPESYFLGSDLIYIFMAMNGLMHWNDQKYKPDDEIVADYPRLREEFLRGTFPPEIMDELRAMLGRLGRIPIIVRSSSQLEDNFGTSFAGKYDSYFCPNQGSDEENLLALTQAIARTYASTLKPDALLYRRARNLQDYDERMAILIQAVQGEKYGRYFLPHAAGVAFSRNLYRWSPQIRQEDGFVRLVWGLGTRAVERTGNDFPRLVALSHPTLHPDDDPRAVAYYSQKFVDLIDLQDNAFQTLPIRQVLAPDYNPARLLTQVMQDGYLASPRSRLTSDDIPDAVFTFDTLLRRTAFPATMVKMLRLLEQNYNSAVDVEFTLQLSDLTAPSPRVMISLLQCRPQSRLQAVCGVSLPEDLPEEDIIFSSHYMVPQGYLPGVRYVLFVEPEAYFSLKLASSRSELSRAINRLNAALPAKAFICVGPGRWGTTNFDLGVFVTYGDIFKSGALVELAGKNLGTSLEPSLGTHFFQDLMEAQIYPLALSLDERENIFNHEFFYNLPNRLGRFVEASEPVAQCLRLLDVEDFRPGCRIELVMDDEEGRAVAFLLERL